MTFFFKIFNFKKIKIDIKAGIRQVYGIYTQATN